MTMFSRIRHLKVFFKDPHKKSLTTIIKEVIHFTYLKKMLPTDYFRKFLYRKDVKDYQHYLSIKEYYSIIESENIVFPEISALLNNKLSFKLICNAQDLPIPELISYNLKNRFVYEKEWQLITNKEELLFFFKKILKNRKLNQMFLKPIDGIGGAGCILFTNKNLDEQIKKHANTLLVNSYIHEQFINQHPEISRIHPHAINTLRIVHYIDKKYTVHILSVLMRFGTGKNITDNTSSGGFSIAVNSKTGKLEGIGRQDVLQGGGIHAKHPDSHITLEGFIVPYFMEACALVKEAANYFPNRIVGWDIAISENGPVIIEANHNPSLHISDVAYGGYGKHPLIKDILKEIKHKK